MCATRRIGEQLCCTKAACIIILTMGIAVMLLSFIWIVLYAYPESIGGKNLIGVCILAGVMLTVTGMMSSKMLENARNASSPKNIATLVVVGTLSFLILLAAEVTTVVCIILRPNVQSIEFGVPLAVSSIVGTCCLLVVLFWSCRTCFLEPGRGRAHSVSRAVAQRTGSDGSTMGEDNYAVFVIGSPPSYDSLVKDSEETPPSYESLFKGPRRSSPADSDPGVSLELEPARTSVV